MSKLLLSAIFFIASASTIVSADSSGNEEYTHSEYINSCAACHGVNGKGDGPMRSQLITQPKDLTVLSQENGGSFPETVVYQIIDGRRINLSHGSSEMPVWGRRFYDKEGNDEAVNYRITIIIEHLKRIQN